MKLIPVSCIQHLSLGKFHQFKLLSFLAMQFGDIRFMPAQRITVVDRWSLTDRVRLGTKMCQLILVPGIISMFLGKLVVVEIATL